VTNYCHFVAKASYRLYALNRETSVFSKVDYRHEKKFEFFLKRLGVFNSPENISTNLAYISKCHLQIFSFSGSISTTYFETFWCFNRHGSFNSKRRQNTSSLESYDWKRLLDW